MTTIFWENFKIHSFLAAEVLQVCEILDKTISKLLIGIVMAADGLVTQEAKASVVMVLTLLTWNIRVSAPGPWFKIDGLVQERCNCSVLAMQLRLPCTNPYEDVLPVKEILLWR